MTNNEFLDDIERRGINGDVFTLEETKRLWELTGARIPPAEIRDLYMRNRVQHHVRIARRRLIELGTKRMKGAANKL